MVYATFLDLCLLARCTQYLLMSQTDGLCAVKHLKSLLFSSNPLLNLHAAVSFLYMHLRKSMNGSFCLLMMWRIIAKAFKEVIDSAGLSFLNSEFGRSISAVVFQFLCYPFLMVLYIPEASAHENGSNTSDICLLSSQREIEVELMIEVWKSLFDSLSSVFQNKPLSMNNYVEGLSQMLIRVLDGGFATVMQDNAQSLWNYQKIGFLLVFGEILICVLKHAQVLYVDTSGSIVNNQQDNSQNPCSPINNSLGLVARYFHVIIHHVVDSVESFLH